MTAPRQGTSLVHVTRIVPDPANVREQLGDLSELVASMRAHGVVQPLLVRPHPDRDDMYVIVMGHRRLEAAKLAGQQSVPVRVRYGLDRAESLELMLIENVHRRDLTPLEKAEALDELRNRGYSNPQISERTGIPSGSISHYLTLLELDEASQERIRAGQLPATEAVSAVRQVRKQTRRKRGSKATWSWEPDHLAAAHPLAKEASQLCDQRGHTLRRRVGRTACGQCWEEVIRADERAHATEGSTAQ